MEKQRKLKVIILSTLIVGILTLTIAFSAMSRLLNISGIGKMDTATWDVHFENLSDASITRDAIEVSKPNISLDKGTVENINVKLTKPKDEIKYVVDIVNKGTIDAEVNVMTISDLTEEEKKLIDFGVYYLNGTKINKYDLLEPGDVKSIAIKIRYKDDITEEDLPSEPLEINLSCQIEYVQSGAEMVITPENNLENVTSSLALGNPDSNYFFNGNIVKESVETITFLSTLKVPTEARNTAWDASLNKDGSVISWYTDLDENGLYELNIGGNKKVYAPEDCSWMFYHFDNLKGINFNGVFDTNNVANMSYMFDYCLLLANIDFSTFNTSNVTNMMGMFFYCTSLTDINLKSFDTTNVTYFYNMFYNCTSLTDINLKSFDTTNVISMREMFYRCRKLTNLDLSSFNTSNVTNMSGMFEGCISLSSINLSNFDTHNVKFMNKLFFECSTLSYLDLSHFDTSKVTDMSGMFSNCFELTNLDISNFNTSNVTTMEGMFAYCKKLSNLNISSFDTSKVTNMYSMFNNCTSLISLNLDEFNTKSVTSMNSMFSKCSSLTNLNLSSFDTSNVTDMYCMFHNCTSLITLIFDNAIFDNVTNYARMLTNVPDDITIYVKDETAKEFILNIRSDANVIIGAPTAYNKDGLKNHLFLLHFFIIFINKYRR